MSGILKTNILKDYLETVSYNVTELVDLVKNQTIPGIKTFTSSPIVPTPTAGTQVANKSYVDSASGGAWSANDTRVKTALNASGTAPIYACRAWVNFNGTGTVAIRASGNVSSITDNGVGDYTVNFATAMSDVNYSISLSGSVSGSVPGFRTESSSTSYCSVFTNFNVNPYNPMDMPYLYISIFR